MTEAFSLSESIPYTESLEKRLLDRASAHVFQRDEFESHYRTGILPQSLVTICETIPEEELLSMVHINKAKGVNNKEIFVRISWISGVGTGQPREGFAVLYQETRFSPVEMYGYEDRKAITDEDIQQFACRGFIRLSIKYDTERPLHALSNRVKKRLLRMIENGKRDEESSELNRQITHSLFEAAVRPLEAAHQACAHLRDLDVKGAEIAKYIGLVRYTRIVEQDKPIAISTPMSVSASV